MIFSAGAYALGAGLTATKLMDTLTKAMMDGLGLASMSYFSLYALLTGIFIASHFIFQSKNMRTIIFMPIVIGIAQELKIDILSLAIPVALCINVCWSSRLMLNRTQCFTVQINIRWANLSTMALLCLFSTGWV